MTPPKKKNPIKGTAFDPDYKCQDWVQILTGDKKSKMATIRRGKQIESGSESARFHAKGTVPGMGEIAATSRKRMKK